MRSHISTLQKSTLWILTVFLISAATAVGARAQEPVLNLQKTTSTLLNEKFVNRQLVRDMEIDSSVTYLQKYNVKLHPRPNQTVIGSLVERVPYDAVVSASGASIIKRPELLSLRMPFDGDFPMSLEFGHVNPVDHLGMPYHDGVDYAIPSGTSIIAVDDGEVIPYREANSYGVTIAIQHSWGRTYYGHLSSGSAQIGDRVRKGDEVGTSGNTGLSTGPHLHFTMIWGDENPIDPDPHIRRQGLNHSNQKEIVWPLETNTEKQEVFEYSYVFTSGYQDQSLVTRFDFGPAKIIDQQTSCLPEFVSNSLRTHYDKNAPAPARLNTSPDDICPVVTSETSLTTRYVSDELPNAPQAIPDTDKIIKTTSIYSSASANFTPKHEELVDAQTSNVLGAKNTFEPPKPIGPTTNTNGLILWYDTTKKNVAGYDTLTQTPFTIKLNKKKEATLVLDKTTYTIVLGADNLPLLISPEQIKKALTEDLTPPKNTEG